MKEKVKTAAAAPAQHGEASNPHKRGSRRQLFIVAGMVLVIILSILAVPYYQTYVLPVKRIVLTVDNVKIAMKYFIERTSAADTDPLSMLQQLTEEEVIKLAAPQYGLQVSDADLEQELRKMAAQGSESISEVEYKEWYRQQLNNGNISDSQYKEIVRYRMLAERLQNYLAERAPTVLEQIHLQQIVLTSHEDAQKASASLKGGKDFAAVAQEYSIDAASREKGGDVGWLPPLLLSTFQSQIAALGVKQISDPLPYFDRSTATADSAKPAAYYIFRVTEKDMARQIDERNLQILKARALELWLPDEIKKHSIKYDFNSEILAWMQWQLKKNS